MDTLEDRNFTPILTLQEAIGSLKIDKEGALFQLKFKHDQAKEKDRVIRIRKSEVQFDGEKRIIL